jgi:hypothetical protein
MKWLIKLGILKQFSIIIEIVNEDCLKGRIIGPVLAGNNGGDKSDDEAGEAEEAHKDSNIKEANNNNKENYL